jgi:membrane protease YdiL (CAAX protease family)
MIRWIKTHDILAFFGLAFLITFAGWVPVFLALPGADIANIIGLWGPALAGLLVTALTRGKLGLKELFRRLLLWRVPLRWYLVILFGWPAISILAALLHARLTGQPLSFRWDQWSGFLAWLVQALLLGFWACEEVGWRGFALPRLLDRWNALTSSIILGIVWACWHLPYFLIGMPNPFYAFVVYTVSVSILMTWVFNHTRGSLFLAIFFHFWINIYSGLQADKLPLNDPGGLELIQTWLLAGAAVLVVILYGYRTLTRDRAAAALNSGKVQIEKGSVR